MIDDKVPPLCCLGPDYFRGFCPVSEGKAFLKHLISKKKKNQDQPSTSYKNSLAVQDAAMAFVFRLLSLCFWHISTPASHQAELVFKWIGVFFRHICCCWCRHRYLCQDPFVASTTVRGEMGELIIDSASIFFSFCDIARREIHPLVEWGIFFFFFFCTDIRLSWRRDCQLTMSVFPLPVVLIRVPILWSVEPRLA